jgi:hypothetical protein
MVRRIIKVMPFKMILCLAALLMCIANSDAQKYFSKTGKIHFLSQAPLEKIEATNTSASVVIDAATGAMEWAVLIKGFQFEKALMQDHFNENYLESHKFPKALFKGTVTNWKDVNLSKDGEYTLQVSGQLTIHGVTKPYSGSGKLKIKSGALSLASSFDLTVADYQIEIPKVVSDNIARTVKVSVSADLQKLN